eukprot:1345007-Amorphochlora_amoeboformis.AAC.1
MADASSTSMAQSMAAFAAMSPEQKREHLDYLRARFEVSIFREFLPTFSISDVSVCVDRDQVRINSISMGPKDLPRHYSLMGTDDLSSEFAAGGAEEDYGRLAT